jgi:hypothetical protein
MVAYVAVSTGHRDNLWDADAWEHHRAVANLTQGFLHPDNPTVLSPAPSIRYSPYGLGLAGLARLTGADPYALLSLAAVFNTALLVLGVWFLLRSFGEQRAAPAALLMMVSLYGEPPGYSSSYALVDLPWLQVNPSAWSFALVVFGWGLLKRAADVGRLWFSLPAFIALLAVAALDHGPIAALGLIGLIAVAITLPSQRRTQALALLGVAAALAFVLCLCWPCLARDLRSSRRKTAITGSTPTS